MITFYGYERCSTCQTAKKRLEALGLPYREVDITERAPPKKLLKNLLGSGYTLGDLFNRSGVQYRELKMKDKLKGLSESEALDVLAGNGRLCKRPIITDGERHTVGFKEDAFTLVWG